MSWVKLKKKYKQVTTKEDLAELFKEWPSLLEASTYSGVDIRLTEYFDPTDNYIWLCAEHGSFSRDIAKDDWIGTFSNFGEKCKGCGRGVYTKNIPFEPFYYCDQDGCNSKIEGQTTINRPWTVDL